MKGILLLSHGNMAEGMLQSASLFFGDNIEQVAAMGIHATDNPDDFEKAIGEKVKELDTGDGVLILCDLFAGTPAHKTTAFLNQGVNVICGMNFPLFLELLGLRMQEGELELDVLIEAGRAGITPWALPSNSDDDFY